MLNKLYLIACAVRQFSSLVGFDADAKVTVFALLRNMLLREEHSHLSVVFSIVEGDNNASRLLDIVVFIKIDVKYFSFESHC